MLKILFDDDYISLFDDGSIGISDGVGYVGQVRDVNGLYIALKKYFEDKKMIGEIRK
jgi:hypothetical protein